MTAAAPATRRGLWIVAAVGILLVVLFIIGTRASARVGATFLKIPGVTGSWTGTTFKQWVKVESRDWVGVLPRIRYTGGIGNTYYPGPAAPLPGVAHQLAVAVDKKSPDLPALMKLCAAKTLLPDVGVAEPRTTELRQFPTFFEYRLKQARISQCVVVPDAPEQSFIVDFQDIEWLNFDPKGPLGVEVKYGPEEIPNILPAADDAHKKAFVITWFGWATLGDDNSCPVMNDKPPQSDYYALLPKEEADKERAKRGEQGVSFGNSTNRPFMDARGPNRLNVCAMPGIVRVSPHAEPVATKALGVNLDGNDGSGAPAPGTCRHKNFVAEDGSIKGVDNQLFRVYGCVPGYRGKKGFLHQTNNSIRADGNVVTLIEISGIDNPKNDDRVEIRVLYAQDKAMRGPNGQFLPNYSYRMTDDPNFSHYNALYVGKIVNGYVVTPPIKKFELNNGQGGIAELADAQFRLKIMPNGDLKGVVGGYFDWRMRGGEGSSYGEGLMGFSCPGVYDAFKRNADGLKDPVSGQCIGISAAWEIDAVPAFVTTRAPKIAQSGAAAGKP